MWKKDEMTDPGTQGPQGTPASEGRPVPNRATPERGSSHGATIGPSITVRGEVSGNEDLLIQGRVEGSVELKEHSVTVGKEGRVKANIEGRIVTVDGEVEGDLHARDQAILRSTAKVQGDITAPRVILEDGATFRGLVDMGAAPKEEKKPSSVSASPTTTPKPETGGSKDEEKAGSSPSSTDKKTT